MRIIFICFFVSFLITLQAQTQDSFNLCAGYETNEDFTYLIPNPDFEEFACCPSSYSQMHCVRDWTQPTTPTSDYMHTCGFVFQAAQAAGLVPFPSGEGIVGTIFAAGWQEYISVCLNEPILADKRLFLKFKIAYTPIDNFGKECNAPSHSPIDIVVYGHNNCGSMALPTNGCPLMVDPQWKILGKTNYQPLAEWAEMVIEINTIEDVNAIILGSPCLLPSDYLLQGCLAYFYYDDFTLTGDIVLEAKIMATEEGHPCLNNYQIMAEIDTTGGEWQWFLDGEILSGETDPTIDISQKTYTSGVYSLRYIIGEDCMLYQKEVNLEEMQLIHWEANVVHDDGTGKGSIDISIEEERPPYQITWAHGSDSFSLTDLEHGDYYATVTDALGCTSSIEVRLIDPKSFFITIWNTALPGNSNNNQIEIPGIGTNYSIYWEEINQPENRNSTKGTNTTVINFQNPGIYRVSITPEDGTFHRIHFNDEGDKNKVLNIAQWGDIEWSSFSAAFKGCQNLNCNASDLPLLRNVTDMSAMFSKCSALDGPLNIIEWDVSNVIYMDSLFYSASIFNHDIGSWNVANVADMSWMFYGSRAFNQEIGSWDVSNVTNMKSMFYSARSFNKNIGNWDVSNVTNMSIMFSSASSFNQDLGSWNVSNVDNMSGMFSFAVSFNQDIDKWNVANVKNMSWMFYDAIAFNKNIGNWDVDGVTDMNSMFFGALLFNQNIGVWNVSNVKDMSEMFHSAELFNQNIGDWDVANVSNMHMMFSRARTFNQDIGRWNVGNVVNMSEMFASASAFNQDIGNWDVANVKLMGSMFSRANSFNQEIGGWNVSNVSDMSSMFFNAISFNQDIGSWNVSKVSDMRWMFYGASSFNQDIGRWNVAKVNTMSSMFSDADSFNQDIGSWNVGSVFTMSGMFSNAVLFNQDIGNWNVEKVTDMNSMFLGASSFNQNIGSWNIVKVIDMNQMFNESGLECANYTATLVGWNDNPTTPNGRILGAEGLLYGIEAETARSNLITSKGWSINGDSHSGVECLMTISTITTEIYSKMKLFPNPFDNQLVVEFSGEEQVTLVLYDQLSRQVVQQSFYRSTEIDTEHLPYGLYMYELKKNNQIIRSGKIVKQ
jgi:surface protein